MSEQKRVCTFQEFEQITQNVNIPITVKGIFSSHQETETKEVKTNTFKILCTLTQGYYRYTQPCKPELCPFFQLWKSKQNT
jgi:hypothetical protein